MIKPTGDKVLCNNCGATISPYSIYCPQCGKKQHRTEDPAAPVTPTVKSWFTQAGNLDGTPETPNPKTGENDDTTVQKDKVIGVSNHGGITRIYYIGDDGLWYDKVVETPDISAPSEAETTPFYKPVKGIKTTHTPETWERAAPVTPVTPVEVSRCKKCGTAILDGETLCSKCAYEKSIAEKTAMRAEKIKDKVNLSDTFAKYKKPVLIGAAACLVVVVIVILLSMGGPKSESEIIADLPESLTSVYLNDELVPMTVESLQIEKRQTKDGVDNVYCKIKLTNDTFTVTSYQQLTYIKYNGNEWVLDWYAPYATEDIQVLAASDELYDWVIAKIKYYDSRFTDIENCITDCDVTLSKRGVTYVFDISKSVGIMSMTGQIVVDCTLDGSIAEELYWSGYPDYSGVQTVWNVAGTWNGGLSNWGMGWYELTLNIDSLTSDGISCTWHYDQDGDDHSGDSEDCWIIESNEEMIEIGVQYDSALLSYANVTFYTDGTCVASFAFLGDCYLEKN